MARKRYVTSDMSNDEQLAEIAAVNPVAALMWPWIITGMDDWGRMTASPMKIKLTIFPAFPYSAEEIAADINLYAEKGLVHPYEVSGHRYMAIDPAKWFYWQNYIHSDKRTVDKSSIPAPVDAPWRQVAADSTGDELDEAESGEGERNLAELSGDERDSVPSPSSLPPFTFDPSGDQKNNAPCGADDDFPDATETERKTLHELRQIPGWPFEYGTDLQLVRMLAVNFPAVDMSVEANKYRVHKMNPKKALMPNSNPRLQFRNWCEIAASRDGPKNRSPDEKQARIAEKEQKYEDLYVT